MRIERVQEGSPGDAIRSPTRLKAGGIHWTCIAADSVVPAAARIIGVVYSELSVIKNIEKVCVELKLSGLRDLKVLYQTHIKVQAARIIQEVSTGIAKGQSPRCHELRWITQQRAKALIIVCRL